MTRDSLPMIIAIAAGACHAPTPPVAAGSGNTIAKPATTTADLACELRVKPFGPPLYLMRFSLLNRTDREKVIRYYRPFMDFKLQVTAGKRALEVVPDTYEGPLGPTELHVPPHGRADLEPMTGLVFATKAEPSRTSWTVIGEPPVEVAAKVDIDDEVVAPCEASIPAP